MQLTLTRPVHVHTGCVVWISDRLWPEKYTLIWVVPFRFHISYMEIMSSCFHRAELIAHDADCHSISSLGRTMDHFNNLEADDMSSASPKTSASAHPASCSGPSISSPSSTQGFSYLLVLPLIVGLVVFLILLYFGGREMRYYLSRCVGASVHDETGDNIITGKKPIY